MIEVSMTKADFLQEMAERYYQQDVIGKGLSEKEACPELNRLDIANCVANNIGAEEIAWYFRRYFRAKRANNNFQSN